MIFVMDIGNTNIKAAVFDGEKLVKRWRCATDLSMTSDQYGITMAELFRYHGLDMRMVGRSGTDVSPALTSQFADLAEVSYAHAQSVLL